MEFESLLLRFLHCTDAKMCLSGEELVDNKHIINGEFCLVGHLKVGSVRRLEIFIFSTWPIPPNQMYPLNQIYCNAPLPPIESFMTPLPSQSNYYIWFLTNQESDKPILSNTAVSDLWPAAVTCAKWWKMVMWLMKDCWIVQTDQKPCLYITKQSFVTASPSAFTLL